jgi:hypothetical protein
VYISSTSVNILYRYTLQCTSLQPFLHYLEVYSVHIFNLCSHSLEVYSTVYISSTSVYILYRYNLQCTSPQPLFTFSRGILYSLHMSLLPLFTFSRGTLYSVHLFNLCLHSLEVLYTVQCTSLQVYSTMYNTSTSVYIL